MNAVEIEEAISLLAEQPFDADEFAYDFLEAFGNKSTTIKRLKSGSTNATDILGAVLQRNNIHIATCDEGRVSEKFQELKNSPATKKAKARFVVATDGVDFEAEDLSSDDAPIVCHFKEFPDHFGFFLPLAGISTVKQIRESSFDIKATGRLNRLYVQLLKDNPEWGKSERRHEMNHFMARLIFCFFAEDTDIFDGEGLFTSTIEQMSERDSSNTHEIMSEVFRAMDTPFDQRSSANIPRWADRFPYVNGGLFSGSTETPKFSKIARSYLVHIGNLDWTKINPDIFGSMIQAVTDEEERSSLGLHYTSVPNILKVLNPLFLDDIRNQLEQAKNSPVKLLNLRKRLSKIRVFDPACGSGNFLVIAYKEMRAIEAQLNELRQEKGRKSDIPLTNFRGIELREFPAEIARLALIIAEYQCDVAYRGQKEALDELLPLDAMNWIVCGNSLRLDWLSICPPTGSNVSFQAEDLFEVVSSQPEIDFKNEGGETYICGNPPYLGSKWQSLEQKSDLETIFANTIKNWKSLDYVAGWFMKAAEYGSRTNAVTALVSTNSICQGQQVPILWPAIYSTGATIEFAHTSFSWANLATHNAGVTVVIVGISKNNNKKRTLYSIAENGEMTVKETGNINPYLIPGPNIVVEPSSRPISCLPEMIRGNSPTDGGHLLLESDEIDELDLTDEQQKLFVKPFIGSKELISGNKRYCIWIDDCSIDKALEATKIRARIESVKEFRLQSKKKATVKAAKWPHRFDERKPISKDPILCVPVISSENRPYLPAGILPPGTVISNKAFSVSCKEIWPLAVICSRMNLMWVSAVCARMRTDYSYTNTLGWNTFPLPDLTAKQKIDLTRCAEEILLAREVHFPASIADLYNPVTMPENLRHAHERNDEVLERIYIGRRFKNDTERLEKLFELYTQMTNESKIPPNKTQKET